MLLRIGGFHQLGSDGAAGPDDQVVSDAAAGHHHDAGLEVSQIDGAVLMTAHLTEATDTRHRWMVMILGHANRLMSMHRSITPTLLVVPVRIPEVACIRGGTEGLETGASPP